MLWLQLVSIVLVALVSQAKCLQEKKNVPVFVKTMQDLYRGPPMRFIVREDSVAEKWITQPLDHFDESNKNTYEMRYFINDEFLTEGSPIFIFLGGEWEANPGMITQGHLYDMAKEHNAVLIYTEHRFYGKSVPTKNMSLDNLQYLNVKQALADVAHFIKTCKLENASLTNSKVVLVGGSYSATMVVWFKQLYPEMVVGGWASSAPLLAKVDFYEYKEVTGKAYLQLGGQQCYNRIQNGIAELELMFENKRSAEARAMLRLCGNFDHENDLNMWNLFSSISNIFASIAQYQRAGDIQYYCSYLLSFDDDASAIANFAYWAWNYDTCIDARYQETVTYYKSGVDNFDAARPWYYQTCNEYGWYQSSRSRNQPFGTKFPATLNIEMCKDIFSTKFGNQQVESNAGQTNKEFGGLEPNVENIYMTHGELDPWSAMGHGVAEGATVISEASHCADFNSIRSDDSAEMRASKERIAELIREWLA